VEQPAGGPTDGGTFDWSSPPVRQQTSPAVTPAENPSRRLSGWFWARLGAAYAIAVAVILLLPDNPHGSEAPPLTFLLLVALGIAAALTPVLWLAVRRDLGFSAQVAAFTVAFNLLVLTVKFVVAPHALYEVNRTRVLESFSPIDSDSGAVLAASLVFVLYASVLLVVYRLTRRRLARSMGEPPEKFRTRLWVTLALGIVAMSLLTGGATAIVALVAAESGLAYLDFVFSSTASVLVAVQLAVATGLATLAFRGAAERARLVGDASLLTALFWVCLAFLAVYHTLWVVYILTLTSIWPLKTVVPK
jgi:hypothetical protein